MGVQMALISVSLKDGSSSGVEAPLTAMEALKLLKVKKPGKVAAVRINASVKDLSTMIESDVEIEPVYLDSEEGVEILRHSASHVMAMAVKELFPGVKVTIGPAIENGFYYDFDYERPFKDEDLEAIEDRMNEIIKADLPFSRSEMAKDEAIAFFSGQQEIYKVELINELDA
jgi:threonyl-tRNA synthetase